MPFARNNGWGITARFPRSLPLAVCYTASGRDHRKSHHSSGAVGRGETRAFCALAGRRMLYGFPLRIAKTAPFFRAPLGEGKGALFALAPARRMLDDFLLKSVKTASFFRAPSGRGKGALGGTPDRNKYSQRGADAPRLLVLGGGGTKGSAGRRLDKVAGKGAGRLGRLRGNVRFLARGGDSGGAGRRGMW